MCTEGKNNGTCKCRHDYFLKTEFQRISFVEKTSRKLKKRESSSFERNWFFFLFPSRWKISQKGSFFSFLNHLSKILNEFNANVMGDGLDFVGMAMCAVFSANLSFVLVFE